MTALIYSDPHIGVTLRANTTSKSRERLRSAITNNLMGVIERFDVPKKNKVCVGDFFHEHSNSEEIIASAWAPFLATGHILAGNHDLLAHNDKIGSLVFMDRTASCLQTQHGANTTVIYGELGKPYLFVTPEITGMLAMFVPHVYTQELFEKSLRRAAKEAGGKNPDPSFPVVLFLHCNVDSGFAEGHDISLNLTTEMAQMLLDSGIDYIVVGHEHEPRDLLGGRLIVIGNTHPTQFGDIGTKRVLVFENGKFRNEMVYSAESHSLSMDWKQMQADLAAGNSPLARTHWLRLTGTAQASDVVELSKVIKACWETGLDLFAVKSDVAIAGFTSAGDEAIEIANLAQLIGEELKALPDLLALWNEILGVQQ